MKTHDWRKYRETLIGIGFFIFGLIYFALSFTIDSYAGYGGSSVVDSKFMPQFVGVLLMLLGILQAVSAYKKMRRSDHVNEDTVQDASQATKEADQINIADYDDDAASRGADNKSLVLIFAFLLIYLALMTVLGFILSTALYLIATMLLLTPKEKRNIPLMLIITVVVSVGVYFLFVEGLSLILPAGILG